MTMFIGIDPGLSGGLAFIDEYGPAHVAKMPVITNAGKKVIDSGAVRDLVEKLCGIHQPVAVIEKVHAMPGQGVTSMFSFGYGYGLLAGILSAMRVPVEHVRPQAWQSVVLGGIDKSLGKKRSVVWAKDRFPMLGELSDGQADALAMAYYGQLKLAGKI